jgi:hypothetical protein
MVPNVSLLSFSGKLNVRFIKLRMTVMGTLQVPTKVGNLGSIFD